MSDTPKLLCGQEPYFPLMNAFHVMTAIVRGKKPFGQLTGVDKGHGQYWLKCLSIESQDRPEVTGIVAFIETELQKL